MTNAVLTTVSGTDKSFASTGDGSEGNPYILTHALPAETTKVIGATVASVVVLDVTLSLDTNIYAIGDTLAETQEIANVGAYNGQTVTLVGVKVNDRDDQGFGFDLLFFDAATSLGTENSAPDPTDDESNTIVGKVSIGASDFYDLGVNRLAYLDGTRVNVTMKLGAATTSLYVAAIAQGAGTYSAAGITLKLAFVRNS
jgi:hypothetical protein